jgi:uncharacterized alkaline shock family protein YloU
MQPQDTITIAPPVLLTIARLATLDVEGVARMGSTPGGFNRWLRRTPFASGVHIQAQDNSLQIDLYIVLHPNANMREVGRQVQHNVARSINDLVGMEAEAVNVHIEDVEYLDDRRSG